MKDLVRKTSEWLIDNYTLLVIILTILITFINFIIDLGTIELVKIDKLDFNFLILCLVILIYHIGYNKKIKQIKEYFKA